MRLRVYTHHVRIILRMCVYTSCVYTYLLRNPVTCGDMRLCVYTHDVFYVCVCECVWVFMCVCARVRVCTLSCVGACTACATCGAHQELSGRIPAGGMFLDELILLQQQIGASYNFTLTGKALLHPNQRTVLVMVR